MYSDSSCRLISWVFHVKLSSSECHKISHMISEHWFRLWLGAVRQQAITRTNVDLDLCCYMASIGHNELINCVLVMPYGIIDLGQHWHKWCVAWWHQAITWKNVDLSSKVFCGIIHLTANSQDVLMNLTFNVGGPSYLSLIRSISWLLMPWHLASPGHQQPWYWLCKIGKSWTYTRKDFNYLWHVSMEEQHKV